MDRFQIRGELGSGGFGTVFRALDRQEQQLVALKLLHVRDPHALRRFKAEFRTLAHVAHEHLASVYELHQDGERWFFTMEYIDGVPFDRYLLEGAPARAAHPPQVTRPDRPSARARRPAAPGPDAPAAIEPAPPEPGPALTIVEAASAPGGSLLEGFRRVDPGSLPTPTPLVGCESFTGITAPDAETLASWELTRAAAGFRPAPRVDHDELRRLFRQLVEGLAWLHQAGALHRDIKPSNVLVTREGQVKIVDFGLVSHRWHSDPGDPEPRAGTPSYMAPEQCAGRPATPASDWYSVGVMLYVVLTDRLPFQGDPERVGLAKQALDARRPSQVVRGVPADLDEICMALLARNPIDRPGLGELLAAFGPNEPTRIDPSPDDRLFVGRAREVRTLVDALSPVTAGAAHASAASGPRVVLVQAPTGLGKSALVEHVLGGLPRDRRAVVLRSHGFERGNLRYRALDGAVDDLSRVLVELPEDEVATLLPSGSRERETLAAVFPVLGLGVAGGVEPDDALALRLLRETLGRLSAERPVIVFVDDLEWVDRASIDALVELLRPSHAPAIGWIFATAGGGMLGAFTERVLPLVPPEAIVTLTLTPLSAGESERLASELANGAWPGAARIIAEAAHGDPALVEELASCARASHIEPSKPGELVDALVVTQLEHLGAVSREVMELVSVASAPVSTQLVRAVTGAGPRELGLLLQHHLLRRLPGPVGEVVQPWHDEVREAARRACED